MFGTKILNDFENESFGNLNFLLRSTENLFKNGYTLYQWFSTAGPRTGAGPQQFMRTNTGPQQFIPILYFKEALPV